MPGQIHKAYKVMLKLIHPKFIKSDQKIPMKILKNAKGIAFVTVVKAGFLWSGTLGSGIVIARLPDGTWSGPSSVGVAGVGWGALIGASVTDSVIVLNTDLAVKAFAGTGQIKFGGNLSVAAGPVGREGDGSAYLGDGGVAACYSYSHSRGLFAGISLQGAVFMTRSSDNAKFYGCPVKASEILKGKVLPPEFEDLKRLYDVLSIVNKSETEAYSFRDPNMQSFRDSSGVALHATPGAAYSSHKLDDDDDDDDTIPRASVVSGPSGGGFAWGQDEDDDALAKAMMSSAVTEKSDDLQPGWVKIMSETGQPYYWHEQSGKTQWEAPLKQQSQPKVPPPPPQIPKEDPDTLPSGWQKVTAADGKVYYWNEQTNVTQWERPVATKSVASAAATPSVPPRRSVGSANSSVSSIAQQASARGLAQQQAAGYATSAATPVVTAASRPAVATQLSSRGPAPSPQTVAAAATIASSASKTGTPQLNAQTISAATTLAANANRPVSAQQSFRAPAPSGASGTTVQRASSVTATRPGVPARPSAAPQTVGNPFDSM